MQRYAVSESRGVAAAVHGYPYVPVRTPCVSTQNFSVPDGLSSATSEIVLSDPSEFPSRGDVQNEWWYANEGLLFQYVESVLL